VSHVFILVALILAIIELVRSRGMSLICWAVVLMALAFVLPLVPLR
jgi:hypothetical protein